ncbi:MAG: SDR family oxidoreductase [Gemmatimonadota bacterium]|nr:SDR family oxidoreductase [Gemmatimonadota bacterium]
MSDGGGRTALVTGATGGIGEAIVRRLAADGLRVFAGGRRRKRLERLTAEVGGVALPFDVTGEAEVEGARRVVREANARVDVLVNAAGVFDLARVTDTSDAVLNRNLDANLRGAFNVTRTFLPAMLAAGSGLVIHVGSVAGWRAFPENGAYSASKFGLRGFHEVLLEEIRGTGVRACLMEPGAVDTPIWDAHGPDSSPHLPSRGEMLRPGDVAGAVSFVAGLPDTVTVPLLRIERA